MLLYKIYMANIARKLQAQGFPIIRTEPNIKHPEFAVYLFEDTPEFQAALFKIIKK